MDTYTIDLKSVYASYFSPVNDYQALPAKQDIATTSKGIAVVERSHLTGREVFLPVTLHAIDNNKIAQELRIECCTVRVTNKKTIIRTPVSERVGTVKEQYSVGDYVFVIKGVLIGKKRSNPNDPSTTVSGFPDDQLLSLKAIFESVNEVTIKNALAELFLNSSRRIAMIDLEFGDNSKSIVHRPFMLTCESDFVESLEINPAILAPDAYFGNLQKIK